MPEQDETPEAQADPKAAVVTRAVLAGRVQAATGARMQDVKVIMQATLAAMGDALRAGEFLRLPPFGAARVMRQAGPDTNDVMRVAVRALKEKAPDPDRPAKVAKTPASKPPAKPRKTASPAKAARPAKAAKAAKPVSKRASVSKQALAAKDEAD